MQAPYTIGITGGSGSGKTYMLNELKNAFSPAEMCFISQDQYYRPREHQLIDVNGVHNFDLPEAIDWDQLVKDIRKVKAGKPVQKTEYTFNNPLAHPKELVFEPAPILVIEGLFILHHAEISRELDFTIFIEAKDHLKLSRRITRDAKERGYDLSDVLYRYEHHVVPTYEKLIRPLKDKVDVIIPNNSHGGRGLEMITLGIRARLNGLANSA